MYVDFPGWIIQINDTGCWPFKHLVEAIQKIPDGDTRALIKLANQVLKVLLGWSTAVGAAHLWEIKERDWVANFKLTCILMNSEDKYALWQIYAKMEWSFQKPKNFEFHCPAEAYGL